MTIGPSVFVSFLLNSLLALASLNGRPQNAPECATSPAASDVTFSIPRPASENDSTVIVIVCMARQKETTAIGSYHLELLYDPDYARVISSAAPPSDLRVSNTAIAGVVGFAGASTRGFMDGVVETVRFRVRNQTALSLALRVKELNSIDSRALKAVVKISGPKLAHESEEAP